MLLATSRHTIAPRGEPDARAVAVLAKLARLYPVGVLSNQGEPAWFGKAFGDSDVKFVTWPSRADGRGLRKVAKREKVPPHKVVVLAGDRVDIAMAKNGGAVVVGAGWVADSYVATIGLKVDEPKDLEGLIRLVEGWSGEHWYQARGERYSVEAICDASTWYQSEAQKRFGSAVREAVKEGGKELNGLLAIASCLLVQGGVRERENLMWGVYPSSASGNDDKEVLSDFGHRLRTSVSQVRMARRGQPLFIRHKPTVKRSTSQGVNRTDPATEVESIQLNPAYRSNIANRNVVVIDDCATYGISMATAAGFLLGARARSVTCVAVGKFGDRLVYYDLKVASDPFAPVGPDGWSYSVGRWNDERKVEGAQEALRKLLGPK